jgi:hypothetical protein
MINNTKTSPLKRRNIALYPGAFRPPHAAHMHAVRHLINRPDVDEVIIVISNRVRQIPTTPQALETDISRKIWAIYLHDLDNVRVEVAETTAIQHALAYFNTVEVGDTLLFCVGEADLHAGDARFNRIQSLAKKTGIQAKIIAAPTGTFTIRSTQLRATLAKGEQGREAFWQALPPMLSAEERHEVWAICQQNKRSMTAITQERIQTLLTVAQLAPCQMTSGNNALDPLFFVKTQQGQSLVIKYAAYATCRKTINKKGLAKSRERVSTERLALKWLNATVKPMTDANILFPHIMLWQKQEKMLVMSHPCEGGMTLAQQLEGGKINRIVARRLGAFLGECHSAPPPDEPFWESQAGDRQHWLDVLALYLSSINTRDSFREPLNQLRVKSEQATQVQFVHLDFQPNNILIKQQHGKHLIAVVDFERASTLGDAAFDLGMLLGHYLFYSYLQQGEAAAWRIHQSILDCYVVSRKIAMRSSLVNRANAFAGSAILLLLMDYKGDHALFSFLEKIAEHLILNEITC